MERYFNKFFFCCPFSTAVIAQILHWYCRHSTHVWLHFITTDWTRAILNHKNLTYFSSGLHSILKVWFFCRKSYTWHSHHLLVLRPCHFLLMIPEYKSHEWLIKSVRGWLVVSRRAGYLTHPKKSRGDSFLRFVVGMLSDEKRESRSCHTYSTAIVWQLTPHALHTIFVQLH